MQRSDPQSWMERRYLASKWLEGSAEGPVWQPLEALHAHLGCPMGQQNSVWKARPGQVRRRQPSPGWRTVEGRGSHGSEVGGAQREGRPDPQPEANPFPSSLHSTNIFS